jgi:hypothetical protein
VTPLKIDEELDQFEDMLRQLKNKYDQFFNGLRKLPPLTERRKLDAFVQEMSKDNIRDNAKRFRFNTMLGRYNQFREMWGRKMREREEGPLDYRRRLRAMTEPLPEPHREAPAEQAPVTSEATDPYVRVTSPGNGAEIQQVMERIRAEHEKLGKAANLNLEQLQAVVEKQAEAIRQKFNVNGVAFRVETVDGKVKLKAKPIQDR